MSLAERAANPPAVRGPGMQCPIKRLLEETLDRTEAAALRDILDAPWSVWPHSEVEKAIEEEGHRVGKGAVGKHRRLNCRCGKP